jgi:hypothetical protein
MTFKSYSPVAWMSTPELSGKQTLHSGPLATSEARRTPPARFPLPLKAITGSGRLTGTGDRDRPQQSARRRSRNLLLRRQGTLGLIVTRVLVFLGAALAHDSRLGQYSLGRKMVLFSK